MLELSRIGKGRATRQPPRWVVPLMKPLAENTSSSFKNLIAQALSNLLENAVKYSNLGTTIAVDAVQMRMPKLGEGSWTGFSVQSVGLQIRPDEFTKLTERGYRGGTAKQRIPAGTGIGLYLSERVMSLHEGALNLRVHGSTATFMLLFPESRIL